MAENWLAMIYELTNCYIYRLMQEIPTHTYPAITTIDVQQSPRPSCWHSNPKLPAININHYIMIIYITYVPSWHDDPWTTWVWNASLFLERKLSSQPGWGHW